MVNLLLKPRALQQLSLAHTRTPFITYSTTTFSYTYEYESEADDIKTNHGGQPPTDAMTQRPEQIGSNQVRDGGWQKGRAQLPLFGIHLVHHKDGKRRLQHCNAHVSKRNRTWSGRLLLRITFKSQRVKEMLQRKWSPAATKM